MSRLADSAGRAALASLPEAFDRRGFSLLELLIAALCTTLLAGAVFSLVAASAAAGRRYMAAASAQRISDVVTATLARDVRTAGRGLEHAAAVSVAGRSMPVLGATPNGLRIVRAVAAAAEVVGYLPASTYALPNPAGLAPGILVAALDSIDRPVGAPLAVGTVVGVIPTLGPDLVTVAWGVEVGRISTWGAPRALLPIEVREYEISALAGAFRLRRRDDSGPWQLLAADLASVSLRWWLDSDADGLGDTWSSVLRAGTEGSVCGVGVEAEVVASLQRARSGGGRRARSASHVRVGVCARVAAGNTIP